MRLLLLYLLLFLPKGAYLQNNYEEFLNLSYPEIDSLANLAYNNGTYQKAIPLMQAGREKAINEFGEQDSIFALYTNNLGFFYEYSGKYDLALPLYLQSINIIKKVLGVDHPTYATFINNLAYLHQMMGNYDLALPLFKECINIEKKVLGIDNPSYATSLNNLATLYETMGNYDLALPLHIKSINIREKTLGRNHPDFAQSLQNLAILHKNMGNYELALSFYIEAKTITEKMLGENHPDLAISLNMLATLYQKMGNHKEALPLFIQAKNIRKIIFGENHPDFATSLNNLAGLYQKMGNSDLALSYYTQAKNIYIEVFGIDHPYVASSLSNLAGLYQKMGNHKEALPLFIQAKNIREIVFDKNHPKLALSLNNLAKLYEQMGNYEQAWNLVKESMNKMTKLNINHSFSPYWLDSIKNIIYPSNSHAMQMVKSLKIAYQLLKKDRSILYPVSKQLNISDLASALLEKARNQTNNEQDKLRILAQSNYWLLKNLAVLSPEKDAYKAFNRSDKNKSVLLLQATKSEMAYRLGGLPDSLAQKDKKMLKIQAKLEAKLLQNEKGSLRNELNAINQDLDDFENMIKKEFPKYHKLKYNQVNAKAEDIQALLDHKTALLEYLIGDSISHIFCVTQKQVLWQKSFVTNKNLNYRIKALHHVLSNYKLVTENKTLSYKEFTLQAHWFYQNLVHPVLMNIQDIDNLIIVSDRELGHLPFETFLVEQAPQSLTDYHELHYLVNDFNISYNYSATLWKENKEAPAPKNNGQILGMAANYDLQLDSSMVEVRLPTDQLIREVLKPLPAARKEVEALQGKYQGFFAFDTLASEKMVKNKASDFAILHFAMHGILDSKRPILSSLAFSEDNDNIESNFWQAHEISKMELNADLVVLSACETGYGKFEAGNGIASLARAFMYAGSPALIVSLWQVNDFTTSEIMKNLYENLANAMNKDQALRQAKLQYMKSAKGFLAHPAFWSPFIIIGKTAPVSIKRKEGTVPWVIGGLVAILLLGGGFAMSRKKKEVA